MRCAKCSRPSCGLASSVASSSPFITKRSVRPPGLAWRLIHALPMGLWLAGSAASAAFGAAAADAAPQAAAPLGPTLIVALAFAAIHLLGRLMSFLRTTPRSVWLSAAGGISVAYVFVHILPELDHHQDLLNAWSERLRLSGPSERYIYYVALIGLAAFYGLESVARSSARRGVERDGRRHPSFRAFWLHLASYAAFNVLIGYLLLHREEVGLLGLLTYAVAMATHFVVADQGLRGQFYPAYDKVGRWILAATPLFGWVLGAVIDVPPLAVSALFAFLAGGVVLNVLKEELPEHRESHFWAFALGAGLYAALLLATD